MLLNRYETFEKCFPLSAGFKIKARESRFSGIKYFESRLGGMNATQGLGERGRFSKVSVYDDRFARKYGLLDRIQRWRLQSGHVSGAK